MAKRCEGTLDQHEKAPTNARKRNQNSDHAPQNSLSKTRFRSSVASLVRIQLFHLLSLPSRTFFPRLSPPRPSRLGVNFLLLSKGMGTGRGSDAPRRDRRAPDGARRTEASQESCSALWSTSLLLFQDREGGIKTIDVVLNGLFCTAIVDSGSSFTLKTHTGRCWNQLKL